MGALVIEAASFFVTLSLVKWSLTKKIQRKARCRVLSTMANALKVKDKKTATKNRSGFKIF